MKNKSRLGREEYELELELEREKQLEVDRKKELLQIEQVHISDSCPPDPILNLMKNPNFFRT